MPDDTTILSLPLILPAQAQKHVTHNEALVQLDLIVQLAVINRVLTVAPSVPVIGDRYIVAAAATGAWAGQAGKIALFAETGWQFTAALPGWQAHVLAEGQTAVFDGLVWETVSDGPLTVAQLGVSATPDGTNRLSVSSPATLLNHSGAGHQLKLNKAAAGDTASLLFQTGFSGRAEMGVAGSDDFSVKVSADGSAWATALTSAAATGEVTLPKPVHLGGQASDPASPADGTLWLNTTTGEVRVRTAGATAALGGGVSDGDKGDVTVSGGVWTIDAGAVTLPKLADVATDSFLGRDAAGTGTPEVLTPAQARGILNVADGANAYVHPNHTGDVSSTGDGATVIAAGAVSFAKMQNIATDSLIGRDTGGTGDPEAISVTGGIEFSGTGAIRTSAFTGDVSKTAGGTALTIAANAVDNSKAADMATARIKGRSTAGTGDPEDLTGTQVTAMLDGFTTSLKGLAPASGGGTTNFLRADGSWAAPSGGGGVSDGDKGDITVSASGLTWTVDPGVVTLAKMADISTARFIGRTTAGAGVPEALTGTQATALLDGFTSGAKGLVPASGGGTSNFLRADGTFAVPAAGAAGATSQLQYNNAGALAGASNAVIEGNELRLPFIATPTAPAAGGVKLYGMNFGPGAPAFMLPNGKVQWVQSDLGDFSVQRFTPTPNSTSLVLETSIALSGVGTLTSVAPTVTSLFTLIPKVEFLVTTAAAAAIAGWRVTAGGGRYLRVGKDANAPGGFLVRTLWGPSTGVATATNRCFVGLSDANAAPTDVEPSVRLNIVGMGWDAADANIQIMSNDGTGAATKIDLGASFPVPTTDRTSVYEVQLYSPNSLTQSVSYRVLRYNTTDKTIAAEASGTVTTDLPGVTALLAPFGAYSAGGTSSVIGLGLMGILTAREY